MQDAGNTVGKHLVARPAPRPARVTFGHRLEAALFHGAMALFSVLGIDRASALGGWIGRHIGFRIKGLTKRATRNLALAFPDMTEAERNDIAADVWENLGRTAGEFAHLEKLSLTAQPCRVTNETPEKFAALKTSSVPVIFVSGHFANWEVMSIALTDLGFDYGFVYRAANNPLVDAEIIKRRSCAMTDQQVPKGPRGAKDVLKLISSGVSLALLVDQKMNDGISAPLLGREAMTAPAAARMALKYKARVVPLSIARKNGAYFSIAAGNDIEIDRSDDRGDDVLRLTTKINEALEKDIKARPGQWLWLHNRWPKKG